MDLRSAPLQEHTLPEALAALVEQSGISEEERKFHAPIMLYNYAPVANFPALPARIEAGLYRIAQEALANARIHASAQQIELILNANDQQVHLTVKDDGCGFDPEQVTQHVGQGIAEAHFGLAGMNERAKLLGGRI